MRKIKSIIFFALLGIVFNSCDDKEESVNYIQENYLAGKWIITEEGHMNSQSGIDFAQYVNDATCNNDNIIFNDDMTFATHDFSSVDGSCQDDSVTGSYDRVNHTLTLTYTVDGEVMHMNYIITKLTATELEFNYSDAGELVFLKLTKE